jgi:two-component system chemotaxis response regulator CheB
MVGEIRVLVVDDSAVMRRIITDILQSEGDIKVVDTARNGVEAIAKCKEVRPDVVTMDIEMPVMDGLTSLQYIMRECPCPVVMLSAVGKRQSDLTMKSLERGAVDFIPKTGASLSLDLNEEKELILEKIRVAARTSVKEPPPSTEKRIVETEVRSASGNWVVIIGSSTGGPRALPEVMSRLPANLSAGVLLVQHMPEGFTKSFAERLNWISSLEVREAVDGDVITPGVALLAPGNRHMEVRGQKVHLTDDARMHYVRPAIDITMRTGAQAYGPRVVGVVLTGMGGDGTEGLREIKKQGGKTIAQDEETCVVYGMPKVAFEAGVVDTVAPLNAIARKIVVSLTDVGV